MEPISAAIIAGAAAAAKDTVSDAIRSLYDGLKALILRRDGQDNALTEPLAKLEQTPDSAGWREEVQKALAKTGAAEDPAVLQAAQSLLQELQTTDAGRASVQSIVGSQNAQASGTGASASVTVTGGPSGA